VNDRQFVNDFLEEADSLLVVSQRSLLALTEEQDNRLRRQLIDEVFRAVHTLKGLSGMIALEPAVRLSHMLESILLSLREGQLELTSPVSDRLLTGVRSLGQVVGALRSGGAAPNVDAMVGELQQLISPPQSSGDEQPSGPAALPALPAEMANLMRPEDWTDVGSVLQQGSSVYLATFAPSPALNEQGINVNKVRAELQNSADLLKALPLITGKEVRFGFLLASPTAVELELPGVEVVHLASPPQPAGEASPHAHNTDEELAGYFSGRGRAGSSSVRVDTARLDNVLCLVGDLMVSRSRLQAELAQLPTARSAVRLCDRVARQLNGLREAVTRVRMVPLSEVFERMPLVVRDLAHTSGRSVSVNTEGGETQIDKALVDQLLDPLLHLVRNAVTHGIETPAERHAAGKSTAGLLRLVGRSEGDSIAITVEDDGRGLDAEAILRRAGLPPDTGVSAEKLLAILCRPGFSTRGSADLGSGRGVGMDVVRQAIEDLAGSLTVSSERGRGTRFTIRLPVTLSILHSFIVAVGGERYAISRDSVAEVAEIDPQTLVRHQDAEIATLRGQALPLYHLGTLLRVPQAGQSGRVALVHETETGRVGIVVDRVLGLQEVVVRPMQDPLVARPFFSGATELADGTLALIPYLPKLLAYTGGRL
jgi:two-component system, chemotaxis family, sensor kinase CheA